MADNFSINLNAVLNTNNVEKQIKDLNLKLKNTNTMKIKVNGEEAIKQVRTLTDEFGNLYKAYNTITDSGKYEEGFERISQKVRTVTTDIDRFVNSSGGITTITTEWDNLGNRIETTNRIIKNGVATIEQTERKAIDANGEYRQLGETIEKVTRDRVAYNKEQEKARLQAEKARQEQEKLAQAERERMANTQKTTTYNKQMIDGHKALVKTIEEIDSKGQKTTTTIAKYKNELGQTVTVTNKLDEAGNKMQGTMTTIEAKAKSMGTSFAETIGKVAKFYVATIPIQTFMTVLNEAKEAVVEFDSALTEFKKVSDLSGSALDNYTQKLGELGETVARTRRIFCARVYSNMH